MKIICIRCKKTIGEQEPLGDVSEIKAKCSICVEAEREEEVRKEQMNRPMKGREVLFENGWKGITSLAGTDTPKLSFWDLEVGGKIFRCAKTHKKDLQQYLDRMNEAYVDVTFFHSSRINLPPKVRKGRKNKTESQIPPVIEQEESKSQHFNCTVRVRKEAVMSIFDDKAGRLEDFVKIMVDGVMKAEKAKQPDNVSLNLSMS